MFVCHMEIVPDNLGRSLGRMSKRGPEQVLCEVLNSSMACPGDSHLPQGYNEPSLEESVTAV